MKILRYFTLSMCSLLILLLSGNKALAIDLPKVIDKTNCDQYRDLLIPAMYSAIEKGDYVITPGIINFKYKHSDSFLAAGAKNAGKYDLNAEGDLIDKQTGKYPENLYGCPFPNIDLKDPKAGAKIISNFNFQRYRFMSSRDNIHVMMMNKNGEESYFAGLDYRLYMNGRPNGQAIDNPEKVLFYKLKRSLEPMQRKGKGQMTYIYIGKRANADYVYVPSIRRIRQCSMSCSDPFSGSDSWDDANFMWDGKDSSMNWKYVGEKTILVSFTSPDILRVKELPDGSLPRIFPYTDKHIKLGYEDPNWKGSSWAPFNIIYVPRKVWVVEQRPKDTSYYWGLHVNYIDQETYTIWYKEVYDHSDKFNIWISFIAHYSESQSGKNNTGDHDLQLYIDEKSHHATTYSRYSAPESCLYMPSDEMAPAFFSVNNFLLLSK